MVLLAPTLHRGFHRLALISAAHPACCSTGLALNHLVSSASINFDISQQPVCHTLFCWQGVGGMPPGWQLFGVVSRTWQPSAASCMNTAQSVTLLFWWQEIGLSGTKSTQAHLAGTLLNSQSVTLCLLAGNWRHVLRQIGPPCGVSLLR